MFIEVSTAIIQFSAFLKLLEAPNSSSQIRLEFISLDMPSMPHYEGDNHKADILEVFRTLQH